MDKSICFHVHIIFQTSPRYTIFALPELRQLIGLVYTFYLFEGFRAVITVHYPYGVNVVCNNCLKFASTTRLVDMYRRRKSSL